MPTHERPMPEVEPLVYFGNWCGPNWSAGHRTTKPLTARDKNTPGIVVFGSSHRSRQSPVDLACKAHDIAYDNADKAPDPLARAAMILEADRLLLARVASVSRDQDAGRQDLNMGEVLFLKNIQIAFRSKLIADGYHVIDFARKEEIKALVAGVINTQIAPSGYFFGTPLGRSAPILVRLYGRPPSH